MINPMGFAGYSKYGILKKNEVYRFGPLRESHV